jgi:6-phosphogluconolactonase
MAPLTTLPDEETLARAAAERLTGLIGRAIQRRGHAMVALTGGRTPRRLYEMLGDRTQPWRGHIDWARVHLFWGDERHVPPDDPDSNFRMAKETLLDHVHVPASQVHRIQGELADAHDAARDYERELRTGFRTAGRSDLTFDITLLGLGEDGHIASIFPGSELLGRPVHERPIPAVTGRGFTPRQHSDELVAAVFAPHLNAWRITLTPPALLDARVILMLVAGASKAAAVQAALEQPLEITRWPVQLLRGAEQVEWLVDRAAAATLTDAAR